MERLRRADEVVYDCFTDKTHTGYTFKEVPLPKGEFNLDSVANYHKKEIKTFYSNLISDLKKSTVYPLIRRKYMVDVFGAKKWEIFKYSSVFWKSYSEDQSVEFPYLLDGLIYKLTFKSQDLNIKKI